MTTEANEVLAEALTMACNWSGVGQCASRRMFKAPCPFRGPARTCASITSYDWRLVLKRGPVKRYEVQVDMSSTVKLTVCAFSEDQARTEVEHTVATNLHEYMADNAVYTVKLVEDK